MMHKRYVIASLACGLMVMAGAAQAQTSSQHNTLLSLTVGEESALSISTAQTDLTTNAGTFGAPFAGTTSFTYKIRTKLGGTGKISMSVSDFSGDGTILMSSNNLTYSCGGGGIGTKCTGTPFASNLDTTVIGFASDVHTGIAGDAGTIVWSLINDPIYKVGAYNATVTFTISST